LETWHRHLGVYGICIAGGDILLVRKSRGPYAGKYDLPGGSLERNETLLDALHREFYEETACKIRVVRHLGAREYVVPWVREGHAHTHCHHIALFYEVERIEGPASGTEVAAEDTAGAVWVERGSLTKANASPLALEALAWPICND